MNPIPFTAFYNPNLFILVKIYKLSLKESHHFVLKGKLEALKTNQPTQIILVN